MQMAPKYTTSPSEMDLTHCPSLVFGQNFHITHFTLATGSWHYVQHNQTDEHDRIHHQQMLHVWGVFPKNRHESQ